jgi:hypothetical protein
VASASEPGGDAVHVRDAIGTKAHPHLPVLEFGQQRRHARAGDGAQPVDDPLRVGRLGAGLRHVAEGDRGADHLAVMVQRRPGEGPPEQTHGGGGALEIELASDGGGIGAEFHQVGRHAQHGRGSVGMGELAGVVEDAGVETGGDVGGDGGTHCPEQLIDELTGGGGLGIYELRLAEGIAPGVVVNVHQVGKRGEGRFQRPEPRQPVAVNDEAEVGAPLRRRRRDESGAGEGRVVVRHRVRAEAGDAPAFRLQREGEAEHGAEGIAIGPDMGAEPDGATAPDQSSRQALGLEVAVVPHEGPDREGRGYGRRAPATRRVRSSGAAWAADRAPSSARRG